MNTCPRCETRGRRIPAATLEAQVAPERLARIDDLEGWRLCLSRGCEVVYFRGDARVRLEDTRAVPFHKSDDPERLVCFCFEHRVTDIEEDVDATGHSEIRAAIMAACKAGRDDCERKNPQGRCCLGNVGQVIARATQDSEADSDVEAEGCCRPEPSQA